MRLISLITALFLFFSGCGTEKETAKAMCPICKDTAKHGCLDSKAPNYDSEAVIDNNSCESYGIDIVEKSAKHGCLDFRASNYDSEATIDNNSCKYTGDKGNWSNKQITDTVNSCISNSGESRSTCECFIEIYSSECGYADDSCVNSSEAEIKIEKCLNN